MAKIDQGDEKGHEPPEAMTMSQEAVERAWLEKEERVTDRFDGLGRRWHKVYLGGGAHLNNWLAQCRELAGTENVELERVAARELYCFAESGEELFRIWVRAETVAENRND